MAEGVEALAGLAAEAERNALARAERDVLEDIQEVDLARGVAQIAVVLVGAQQAVGRRSSRGPPPRPASAAASLAPAAWAGDDLIEGMALGAGDAGVLGDR
ncbi:hypothetical protein [Nannocystis pusilla]|uniref:hypothetical protein n=1 Tax=Nannocystis pusilla TaxID=889268 RepID=UPI003B7A8EDD